MRLKIIACEALTREIRLASAKSPHVIDVEFVEFGLHNTPSLLRQTLQQRIDACEESGCDCIALAYGLCSRGTAEIVARSIPIVIPRAHDCITFFLGSRARYDEEFSEHPGTYYFSPGWIERKEGDVQQGFIDDIQARDCDEKFKEYVAKYGEDNAKFLIEQEQQWYQNYSRAAFVNMQLGDIEAYRKFTRSLAQDRGLDYAEIEGDMSLIERLANGCWNSCEFLKIEPGDSIAESFDELVLKAAIYSC